MQKKKKVSYMSSETCGLACQPTEKIVWNYKLLMFSSFGRFSLPDAQWKMNIYLQCRLNDSVFNIIAVWRLAYHQQVIKEEDLSLVNSCPLRSVGVRHLIELATTHQPTMGKGQHLCWKRGRDQQHFWRRKHYRKQPCDAFTSCRNSQASCQQWPFPQPAPVTHGHHWSLTPISVFADRSQPTGPGVYPDRCPHLGLDTDILEKNWHQAHLYQILSHTKLSAK